MQRNWFNPIKYTLGPIDTEWKKKILIFAAYYFIFFNCFLSFLLSLGVYEKLFYSDKTVTAEQNECLEPL